LNLPQKNPRDPSKNLQNIGGKDQTKKEKGSMLTNHMSELQKKVDRKRSPSGSGQETTQSDCWRKKVKDRVGPWRSDNKLTRKRGGKKIVKGIKTDYSSKLLGKQAPGGNRGGGQVKKFLKGRELGH